MKLFPIKLIILLILSANVWADEKIKITTSNYQVASITKMLVGEDADIEIISSYNICPEHYSLKPSDIQKMQNRDLLIYIDEQFEPFMNNILSKHNGKTIKISDIDNMHIDDKNYHIWLDLNNVRLILKEIHSAITRDNNKDNLEIALKQINDLDLYRQLKLGNLRSPILLNNSLFYLFSFGEVNPIKKYADPNNITIKNVDSFLNLPKDQCILSNKNESFYNLEKKINRKIVKIDCGTGQFDGSFIEQYKELIDIVHSNCTR